MKVYGPYINNKGREFVIIRYPDRSQRTVSYAKYLLELKLGRELDPHKETVDHRDRNKNNNSPANLKILDRSNHTKEDAWRVKDSTFICPQCDTEFTKRNGRDMHNNRKKGKAGPFCSRSCAGKYGAEVGHGKRKKLSVNYEKFQSEYKREYYQLDKPK